MEAVPPRPAPLRRVSGGKVGAPGRSESPDPLRAGGANPLRYATRLGGAVAKATCTRKANYSLISRRSVRRKVDNRRCTG